MNTRAMASRTKSNRNKISINGKYINALKICGLISIKHIEMSNNDVDKEA